LINTNKEKLLIQEVVGIVSHPTMLVDGGLIGAYVTTWRGEPKIGFGLGGIKYNVKVGDSCFGWPEAEYIEPGVSLKSLEEKSLAPGQRALDRSFYQYSCVGNEVTVINGSAKGVKGVVTGKTGYAGIPYHVHAHFSSEDLRKINIEDKVRIITEGVGLKIEGFEGEVFNMSPKFLESLELELDNGILKMPVAVEVPAYVMGHGVGGDQAGLGHWCIQTSPPDLVKECGLEKLKIGDIVACKDVLMHYGKGYYKGAITIGVIAFGASDIAGHGPGVFAIAESKNGKLKPVIDSHANIAKYLGIK
jgi:hypothetical protein